MARVFGASLELHGEAARRHAVVGAQYTFPHNINIVNYYADTDEWHPSTWFLSAEHRELVNSEIERINVYRKKGDIL